MVVGGRLPGEWYYIWSEERCANWSRQSEAKSKKTKTKTKSKNKKQKQRIKSTCVGCREGQVWPKTPKRKKTK